jgi:hypothetical protein
MGAWNIVSQTPDVFVAMAVLSADTFLDMTHMVFPYKYFDNVWPEPPNGPIEGDDWSMMTYAYSAAYSPNPDNPPYFVDLPIAWPSGEVIQEVYDRWLACDPVENYRYRLENLRSLSRIFSPSTPPQRERSDALPLRSSSDEDRRNRSVVATCRPVERQGVIDAAER